MSIGTRTVRKLAAARFEMERPFGLLVNDQEVASRFRELRDREQGQASGVPAGIVEAADGTQYRFWVRDEPPERIFDELVTLL